VPVFGPFGNRRLQNLERKKPKDDLSHLTDEEIDARIEHMTQELRSYGIGVPDFGDDYAAALRWAHQLVAEDSN
jgi:hypothetical protein